MNSWQKTTKGWGINCAAPQQPGDVVTVTKRDGRTSQETLGEKIIGNIFAVATVREKPAAVQVGDMAGVCALFDKATLSKLRFPSIVLHIVGLGEVALGMAGSRANVPGSINVKSGDGVVWFGRILRSGTFEPSAKQPVPAGLTDALVAFAAEPAKVARESSRLTGRCVFCNLRLDDPISTAVGYGKTCARRWGQPYSAATAREFMAEAA